MLALALAMLIGVSLTVFGAGGSIVTVPVLVYAVGLDPRQAAGTSLLVVGLVAAVGSVTRWRALQVRTGLTFGAAGMLGAVPGAWLNHHVAPVIVLLGFATATLVAAYRMAATGVRGDRQKAISGATAKALLAGVGVGLATGFFGVGGGFLIVPALTLLLGLAMPEAVATSLMIIALNCGAGLAAHGAYGGVDWRLGLAFTAAALLGAALAAPLGNRLGGEALQRVFAGVLAVVGLGMLAHTAGSLWT